jgi:4-diphosphocytidyl-2-C-methyl-D-erythritol kinase
MAPEWTSWPAPGKLNLFLQVTGRRPDGYHELQSALQFIDRCDQIHLRVRRDGAVRRLSTLEGVSEEDDLTVRTARLMRARMGCRLGCEIRIDKTLPMGGGLGGGSSDAATLLRALNVLWELGRGADELAELGLELGADVPFFVRGTAAWAEGVGERLTPLKLPEQWYLVLVPAVRIATGEIFQAPELTRNSAKITIADFLSGAGRNDCEPVVVGRYPVVAEALAWLQARTPARLTGTGSCVFGCFATRDEAEDILRAAQGTFEGFAARGLNRSPLMKYV